MGAGTESARLQTLLEPVLAEGGVDLERIELSNAGRRRVLRVIVDRDGGVDLDAVAEVSRTVAEALDAAEAMGATPYLLEVTSPGVDRPLTAPRHWRRATGRLVLARLADGGELTARVHSADEAGVELVESARGVPQRLPYTAIARAQVQVEFAPQDPD